MYYVDDEDTWTLVGPYNKRTIPGHDENVEALSHTDLCDFGERQICIIS